MVTCFGSLNHHQAKYKSLNTRRSTQATVLQI